MIEYTARQEMMSINGIVNFFFVRVGYTCKVGSTSRTETAEYTDIQGQSTGYLQTEYRIPSSGSERAATSTYFWRIEMGGVSKCMKMKQNSIIVRGLPASYRRFWFHPYLSAWRLSTGSVESYKLFPQGGGVVPNNNLRR